MNIRRWGVVVLGLLAARCGSSNGGSGSAIPIDDLGSQYVAAGCDYLVRCDSISDTALCTSLFTPLFQETSFNSLGASIAAVKAGKSTYDGVAARRCVDDLRNASCTSSSPYDPACEKTFTGTLTDGSRCIADGECSSASFCAKPAATTGAASCDGTCVPGGTLCNDDSDCAGGQVCDTTMSTATSGGTCVTPVPAGATGAPCGTNHSCQGGLSCSTSATPPTCTPLGQAGAPCDGAAASGCAAGLICVPSDDAATYSCLTDARKGEACQALYQCGGFFSTLVCDETAHACVDAPATGPCAGTGLGLHVCDFRTSYCDLSQSTPTCMPFKPSGASCDPTGAAGSECGTSSDTLCQATVAGGTTGTCVTTPPTACTP